MMMMSGGLVAKTIADFAEGYVMTPKEVETQHVVLVVEYVGDDKRLEIRQAAQSKYFVHVDGERVLINKKDLDLAVHVFGPGASEVKLRFRCPLLIGGRIVDLSACARCHALKDFVTKCNGDCLVRIERPFYTVNAQRVAITFSEIQRDLDNFAALFQFFPKTSPAQTTKKLKL